MEDVHGWEERVSSLKGMQLVVDHAGWVYLEEWLGLKRIATLEPKPGIPPSSGHLAKVLAAVQAQPAAAVLYAAYQDKRSAQWLAARRSEEHTSELQSRGHLVCRLLLEKQKIG